MFIVYNNAMNMKSFKCPCCDRVDELESLRKHVSGSHDVDSATLYRVLFMNGCEPTCGCGCGSVITKFWGIQKGFSKYVRGHHQRVNNNFANSKEGLKKSQDVRREMHKRGEIKIWNKGETKETDERLKLLGVKLSQTILSDPEKIAKRSACMRKGRLDGTVTTLHGKDHPRWKGGTSALQPIVRSFLNSRWTYPKMKSMNYTCQKCNVKGGELNVHHDKERFADILHKAINTLGEPGDSFEKRSLIAEWVAQYHVDNDVSGVVLCELCHGKEHSNTYST